MKEIKYQETTRGVFEPMPTPAQKRKATIEERSADRNAKRDLK